jgi:ketosteroid isomerase-like protein
MGAHYKLAVLSLLVLLGACFVPLLPETLVSVPDAAAEETGAADAGLERELKQLESEISQAVVNRDTAFVDRVWDEDFFYTGVRGELKTKADILAELADDELHFDVLKFDDQRVRGYGDTAVVTGLATTKGRSKQGPITGEFRYTRVYVKRQGAWKLVVFQGTPIAK